MANIPGSVRIAGPVAPTDTSDVYPSHLSLYGKGGIRTVASLSERDAIPIGRRENGMLVYVTSTNKYYKLLDTSTNTYEEFKVGGSMERLYYDAVPYMTMIYPASTSRLINCICKFAPWMMKNDVYNLSKFTFQIDIIDPVSQSIISTTDGVKFATLQSMVDWANASLPHSNTNFSQTFKFTAYEEIDSTIPMLEKGYGSNRFYNACTGSGKYRKSVHCGDGNCGATTYVLFEAWKKLNPSGTYISYANAGEWKDDDGRYAVWCSKNDLRRYNLPSCMGSWASRIPITLHGQGDRKTICENFESVNPVTPDTYRLGNMRICIMSSWGSPPIHSFYDVMKSDKDKAEVITQLTTLDSTACAIYQVKGSASSDNNYALLVKPLGIDAIYTNYIDLTKWDIEAVFENTNRQRIFRTISSGDVIRQNAVRDVTMIRKHAWLSGPFINMNIWRSNLQSWCVRFRLRNKSTLKVGSMTSWKVVGKKNDTNAPIKFMIE